MGAHHLGRADLLRDEERVLEILDAVGVAEIQSGDAAGVEQPPFELAIADRATVSSASHDNLYASVVLPERAKKRARDPTTRTRGMLSGASATRACACSSSAMSTPSPATSAPVLEHERSGRAFGVIPREQSPVGALEGLDPVGGLTRERQRPAEVEEQDRVGLLVAHDVERTPVEARGRRGAASPHVRSPARRRASTLVAEDPRRRGWRPVRARSPTGDGARASRRGLRAARLGSDSIHSAASADVAVVRATARGSWA